MPATAKLALFWDESFLWGLIAYDTFRKLGIEFDLITSEEIRAGALNDFDLLFVPGGWASDKIVALGDEGKERIRDFVRTGGSYLGICGGAGLALSHENGLALAPVSRVPTRTRLPSFSGGIALEPVDAGHAMWRGFPEGAVFHAWWPGQFALEDADDIRILAVYGEPAPDSYITDLPVLPDMDWKLWAHRYGINLNPERIIGEPAVIETSFGDGRVFLSYLHFETPGDENGHAVLLNILEYLAGIAPVAAPDSEAKETKDAVTVVEAKDITESLRVATEELISFGKDNFLWFQRNDWILQWRRGVRGVEYSTLYAMLERLADSVAGLDETDASTLAKLRRLQEMAQPFFEDASKLLLLERDALGQGPISPLKTGDEKIRALRDELFSNSKRCGGLYKEIIDLADEILLPLLRAELKPQSPGLA